MTHQDPPASIWRKSTHSDVDGNGNCVEVALAADAVGVRDSKSPADGALAFPVTAWTNFLATLG